MGDLLEAGVQALQLAERKGVKICYGSDLLVGRQVAHYGTHDLNTAQSQRVIVIFAYYFMIVTRLFILVERHKSHLLIFLYCDTWIGKCMHQLVVAS